MAGPSSETTPADAEASPFGPEVPPFPPGATAEQRDEHWLKYVYRGDQMPQLTVRAVLMGGFLGMAMSIAGLYTTLTIGWSFGVAITACVISYVIWNGVRKASGGSVSAMSILESNCMASTASAAGYSTGSTIATAFGALLLLQPGEGAAVKTLDVQPIWVVASFTFFTAAMGVFLAIPMKRQMINNEQLPFPSGIAAATTLKSLYTKGREAALMAYILILGIVIGFLTGFFNTQDTEGKLPWVDKFFNWMQAKVFNVRLPEEVPLPMSTRLYAAGTRPAGFDFSPSVLLIAAGMIVGLRVSISMLAGSVLLYFVVAPWLISLDAQHAGQADYIINLPLNRGTYALTRWALWGGTSLMVFASLTSIALQWKTILRSFNLGGSREPSGVAAGHTEQFAKIEVPNRWLFLGLVPITIGLLVVQWFAFGISWWLGLVAVGMSFVLSMVACRATGETDTTPIGAMGKVMQLLFAVLSPAGRHGASTAITHNLMGASVAANCASSSADLLTDLKSGYLLGANARKQFLAQFIGIFFGTVAIVPAWYLLVPDKAAMEHFQAPATVM
ncbi:MAG: OPT/YSL family transporter, partial [Phycisphaerales bacterium]|nr:OPT/YSL family transporter [Phycisphaerales bacterium]